MKKIIILSLALMGSLHASEKVVIDTPAKITAGARELVFEVKNDSLLFKDSVIREMAFGKHVTVAYKNHTKRDLSVKFTLKLYNQYGFLLGEEKVGGGLFGGTRLEAGELGGDKLRIDWTDYKAAFKHSNFELPEDFSKVAWVTFSKTNFKLQQ